MHADMHASPIKEKGGHEFEREYGSYMRGSARRKEKWEMI